MQFIRFIAKALLPVSVASAQKADILGRDRTITGIAICAMKLSSCMLPYRHDEDDGVDAVGGVGEGGQPGGRAQESDRVPEATDFDPERR